jgi:hypothetical protein
MTGEANDGGAVEAAARRLDRALTMLEQRMAARLAEASAGAGTASDQDRSQLATALDEAKAREKELTEAGEAASAALSRAIAEIRSTLGEAREASGS